MNMPARYIQACVLAPRNSFQTNTPHSAATIGADWPMAYEMATPTNPAATKLNTAPVPQIEPAEQAEQVVDPPRLEDSR